MRSPNNIRNNCGGRRSFGANRQMVEIEEEEEEDEDDSLEVDSTSSFSLQECIDEFRARRIRRFSTHSRDTAVENCVASTAAAAGASDADLINQNRCNKEQERKCKPCKNGFCYCFSSDSGGDVATRDTNHLRQNRRSRRSEYSHASHTDQQRPSFIDLKQRRRRHSAPSHIKLNQPKPQQNTNSHVHSNIGTIKESRKSLTAISSLKSTEVDAPLIHIIQELHDNCVISEVHVNKQKLQLFHNNTNTVPIHKKKTLDVETVESGRQNFQPTVPTMSTNMSEFETQLNDESFVETSSLENSFSKNSTKSRNRAAAGMLLKKRLSNTQVSFKPQQSKSPPPKPPRSQQSSDTKHSISSLASTSMSLREAERVLDDFLRKRGVDLPRPPQYKRKSYPELKEGKSKTGKSLAPLPSCPSLSDIERIVDSKKGSNYNRNLCKSTQKIVPKPKKEIQFGWTDPDPKITKMLNYDETSEKSQGEESHRIKTKFTQAQPQTVGWQIPHKISLDTVDGNVRQNLASNMEYKETPIKSNRVYSNNNSKGGQGARNSQKFIWSEQLRNLSPWNRNKNKISMRSSLKASSKNFLQHSKKKILRIVSPKKDNVDVADLSTYLKHNKKKLRTIGVQTFEDQQQQQTPPGSYHSPIQSFSTGDGSGRPPISSSSSPPLSTQNEESSEQVGIHFDFSRNVEPPTPPTTSRSKISTSRGRKLEFPRSSNHQISHVPTSSARTYRSYQTDLEQDINLSKMGFLLSNIRNKLEASDNHAMKVFQDVERHEQSWDVDDRVLMHNQSPQRGRFSCSPQRVCSTMNMNYITNEPIYSEIEEESVRISACSQYDNNAGADVPPSVQMTTPLTVVDVNELYAKVNKIPKSLAPPVPPAPQQLPSSPQKDCMPLGTFLHNSMKNSLRPVIIPDGNDANLSYSSPSLAVVNDQRQSNNNSNNNDDDEQTTTTTTTTTFYHSLNNINEKNSPPKKNNNFSKSDLSLQRSEIFLENLCQSEIVIDEHGEADHLEKVDNAVLDLTQTSDNVSYDLPEYNNSNSSNHMNTSLTDNYLGLSMLNPPESHNQSTPKKQNARYISKLSNLSLPNHFLNDSSNILHQNEFSNVNDNRTLSVSALAHYNHLKNVLQRSFRKGKQLFKGETRRLTKMTDTQTKDLWQANKATAAASSSCRYSDGLLDTLLADSNESLSPTEQLSRAVNICRNMPILEVSAEMVEAERLLLFSSLKRQSKNQIVPLKAVAAGKPCQCLWIDAMKLPIRANPTQDFFFNYHFICTFECNGIVKSTQSVECQNDVATFEDCGIEFFMPTNEEDLEIHCKIFMLRLRKISTLQIDLSTTTALEQSLRRASMSASDSSVESAITSRFRQHANFTLTSRNFVPYKLIQNDRCNTSNTNLSLRSSNSWCIPINKNNKSSNLSTNDIQLVGRIEISVANITYAGFLNVQDPKIIHNWNRRWCILDGLQLKVMQEMLTIMPTDDTHIVLTIDLIKCVSVEISPRDLCARPRSFFLKLASDDNLENNLIFLAGETQTELNVWLEHLSSTLNFVYKWL